MAPLQTGRLLLRLGLHDEALDRREDHSSFCSQARDGGVGHPFLFFAVREVRPTRARTALLQQMSASL